VCPNSLYRSFSSLFGMIPNKSPSKYVKIYSSEKVW
jgi:hypothetical protein